MEEPSDPSDWPFRPLADLDGLMRCPICFDYFNTAVMIPNCSHNYCSLCIRRYLTVKQQCPTCSRPVSESQLQCNRLLDELVQKFKSNRKEFMKLLTSKADSSQKNASFQVASDSLPPPHSSAVKPSSVRERRRSSTSAVEKERTLSTRSTSKLDQSGSVGVGDQAVVHILDSPPGTGRGGKPKGKDSSTSTSSTAAVAASDDGNVHLIPEPPGESQLNFDEINSLELEDDDALTVAGNQTETSPGAESKKSAHSRTSMDITPRSKSSALTAMNVLDDSIVTVAPTQVSVEIHSVSSHTSTPSGTPLTAGNTSSHGNTSTLSTPGARGDANVSRESGAPTPSSSNSKVNCPVCSVPVLERYINSHLDLCLRQSSVSSSGATGEERSRQLPKLPKLILTIMKDKELRKKCRDYHLSSQGSRRDLIDRISEFTLQYNAQRDSLHPKTKKEIAQDVERIEKGKLAMKKAPSTPNASQIIRRKSSTTEIEENRKKYEMANESHFSELIAGIRSRNSKPKGTSSVKRKESAGSLKQSGSPSSSRNESINEPSYSPVGVSSDECMDEGVEVCVENGEGGERPGGDADEEIFVPETPELLSKERYSTRQHLISVPESPSLTSHAGSPREPLKRVKRKLSTQLGRKRGAQCSDDSDPDFLPMTPQSSRKKQRRC